MRIQEIKAIKSLKVGDKVDIFKVLTIARGDITGFSSLAAPVVLVNVTDGESEGERVAFLPDEVRKEKTYDEVFSRGFTGGIVERQEDGSLKRKDGILKMSEEDFSRKVTEVGLCEASRVFLKPDQLYIFKVRPGCLKCRIAEAAAEVVGDKVEKDGHSSLVSEVDLDDFEEDK
jgi:hypothetical protein